MLRAEVPLETEVELVALEVEVIAAEAAAGWSVPGAGRPLHPWEVRAKVRFSDLERITDDATGLILRAARVVRDGVTAALLADLSRYSGSPAALLGRVGALGDPTTGVALPLGNLITDAARTIEIALMAVRSQAVTEIDAEATRQGLTESLFAGGPAAEQPASEEERARVAAEARRLATLPLAQVLEVAGAAARSRSAGTEDVISSVAAALTAAGEGRVSDEARQAATRSANHGRLVGALGAPEPEEIYASELMDGRTCGPCQSVDGRLYESLAAALVDYPSGGSYVSCAGGDRCRGTLVFVWATESAPSLDGSDDLDRTPRGPASEEAFTEAEQAAMKSYKRMGGWHNEQLREGVVPDEALVLDDVFNKSPLTAVDQTVSRSIAGGEDIFGPVGSRVGGYHTELGYVSTSPGDVADLGFAREAAENLDLAGDPTIMRIDVPAGSRAIDPDSALPSDEVDLNEEPELLIDRGSVFTIVSDGVEIQPDGTAVRVVHLILHAPGRAASSTA